MEQSSRVITDIDFEQDGKQTGSLDVPYSRNESAWGTLMVPVTCIKNGSGPTILLAGGNHGDEYEGQVAVAKLTQELEPEDVRGRVVLIPALNYAAAVIGTRLSPIDGKNLNRVFPGKRDGSVTSMIAHYVDTVLLPMADVVIDLHSGGTSLEFVSSVVMHRVPDKEQQARTFEALQAFGAPIGLVLEELDSEGMLDIAAERKGKLFLTTELGGGARVGVDALRVAERGLRNVLKHVGVVEGELEPCPTGETRLMDVRDQSYFVRATANGIYVPHFNLGERVEEGQPVGQIVFIADPTREPHELIARTSGMVWGQRTMARVERGDTVAVLASDLNPSRLGLGT